MNYEFASPGPVNADIRIASGSVDVHAGDHSSITVNVDPFDNSSASREAAEQTRVHLEGKHLVVHTPHGKGWALFKWPKLRITVHIPQESVLSVKAASADVTCTGSYNDVVAHTASGDLTVDRVTKDASITSASGDVKINWVGGDLRMNSASGDVSVQHVGKDIDAHSASGDIVIGRADGSARAKTASGDIKVGVTSRGEVRAHSASGDVTVGVAAGTAVWLDLNTASGKTRSELTISDGAPPTGTSLQIKVRTASGDITLNRVVSAD
jgi:hypothetical protein